MIAGTWLALTPHLALFATPTNPWAFAAGPGVEVAIGERHGFQLRTRAHGRVEPGLAVSGLATVELGWLPEIADDWHLGPLLALDVDTFPCTGTSPPFCDGMAVSVGGERHLPAGDEIALALGTELTQAFGDRLRLRPRARVSFTHRSGFGLAADAAVHFQEQVLRAEVGYRFVFGSRERS